jgi:hypothetical protein
MNTKMICPPAATSSLTLSPSRPAGFHCQTPARPNLNDISVIYQVIPDKLIQYYNAITLLDFTRVFRCGLIFWEGSVTANITAGPMFQMRTFKDPVSTWSSLSFELKCCSVPRGGRGTNAHCRFLCLTDLIASFKPMELPRKAFRVVDTCPSSLVSSISGCVVLANSSGLSPCFGRCRDEKGSLAHGFVQV